jgi:hypothetical protein
MHIFKLTTTQARRLATSAAAKVADMDAARAPNWENTPTDCKITQSDQRYRAELLEAYDQIIEQIPY